MLEQVQQVVAEQDAVVQAAKGEDILAPFRAVEVGHAAQGDDQVVEGDGAVSGNHFPVFEVNFPDGGAQEAEVAVAADVADVLHNVTGLDVRRDHLGEQGGKEEEVGFVQEQQVNGGVVAEAFLQLNDGLHAAKARSQHHDTGRLLHRCCPSPAARCRTAS